MPPGVQIWEFPDIPDADAVEMAVVWKHPYGSLRQFPNLRLIQSFGAGVEHLLSDPGLPVQIPVCRIVDESLTLSMRNYVGMAILMIRKRMDVYLRQQRGGSWSLPDPVELPLRVGMLGMGELGAAAAAFAAGMGFEVWGYSRHKKQIEGVTCLSPGDVSLEDFAGMVNVLVCLLPLTSETEGILNYALFRRMPRGSYLINAARGGHLVEQDLMRALDEGLLAGAFLDVFRQEPLPAGHPFWADPRIFMTPHSASVTDPDGAARIVAENFKRLQTGGQLLFEASKEKGY